MAQVGQTIEHPLSGERLTFLETAATTGGDLLKISVEMAPGGILGAAHVHPRAQEEFEVLSGRIQLKTSGKTRVADAGERIIVPRGADHIWGNPFDDPATVTCVFRPALKMETLFETLFGCIVTLLLSLIVMVRTVLAGWLEAGYAGLFGVRCGRGPL